MPGPKQVTAFQGYAIFAKFDALAPDTKDLILVANKELAKKICDELNKDPRAHGKLAYVEGYEYAKKFSYREAIRLNATDFVPTYDGIV